MSFQRKDVLMDRKGFLGQLYQFSAGSVELRALPSRNQAFFAPANMSGINSFCHQNQNDDLYFGIATRDGKGGRKENIVHIPSIWVDVDFRDTPREIIAGRLKEFPFKPSFVVRSGGGIHLYWQLKEPAGREDIPKVEDVNRRIACYLGGDLNACDAARVLRVPGTVNRKYKPPADCKIAQFNEVYYELDDFINMLPEAPTQPESANAIDGGNTDWLIEAMKGVGQGERNATGTKIAGYWINKVSPKDVLTILRSWNLLNKPPLPDNDLQTIVKSVSRYELDKPQSRVDLAHVYDAKRMLAEYRAHIESLKKNRFITRIKEIDRRIRGVAGGEVLTIIARAGSFKTAMLQNLLLGYANNSAWGAVFFSIEMPVASVTERYHQIINCAEGPDIEHFYASSQDGVDNHRQDLEKAFIRELKRLYVVPVKVGVSDIAAYVRLIEQQHNVKVGVIGIDYLGLMDGPGLNEYEVVSRLSRDVKNMAKMVNVPVILLSQVSRKGKAGETEISLDMGRGSGAIEEGSDFVLGLWQVEGQKLMIEDFEPEFNLICKILKNRKGPKGSRWKLDLEPTNLRIGPSAERWDPPKNEKDKF